MEKFGEDISSVREYNKNLYVKVRGKKEFLEIKDAFDEYNRPNIENIAYPLAQLYINRHRIADLREQYIIRNEFVGMLSGKKPSKLEEKLGEETRKEAAPAVAIASFLLLAAFTCFVFTKKIITTYAILDTEIKTLNPFLILGIFLLAAAILFFVKSKKSKK